MEVHAGCLQPGFGMRALKSAAQCPSVASPGRCSHALQQVRRPPQHCHLLPCVPRCRTLRPHRLHIYSVGRCRRRWEIRCSATVSPISPSFAPVLPSPPSPVLPCVRAFGPATVANLGPGFDFLGCAVEGLGDHVTAEVLDTSSSGPRVIFDSIAGDGGRLSLDPDKNCAGIAAKGVLELLGVHSVSISLRLEKGLPLGSGLGSSAASAAAAACAVNALFGSPLTPAQLVPAGLASEAAVSGFHADNIAPAIMGGFVLVRSTSPLEIIPLQYPSSHPLYFVVVSPNFEAPTREMRAVLPKEVSLSSHISNCANGAALAVAILTGDAKLLGTTLASDLIVEPRRGPLIPGLGAVKIAAMAAGAYGCTISGAGPTAVAITDDPEKGQVIGEAMQGAFAGVGKLKSEYSVVGLNRRGCVVVDL